MTRLLVEFAMVAVVCFGGCFHPTYDRPRCGPQGECPSGLMCNLDLVCEMPSGPGTDAETPDARACYGTLVPICFNVIPTTPVMLMNSIDINTDGTSMCDQHNDQASRYCVVAAMGLTLANNRTLTAHGIKPLVLLSTTTIQLSGSIDVSSKHDGSAPSAGAQVDSCPGTTAALGIAGGFGGSFGGKGGDGEAKNGDRGIASAAAQFPTVLVEEARHERA